jgi:ABC-type Fe3+-hydroxamate transport system substrate-binding protein
MVTEEEVKKNISDIIFRALHDDTKMKQLSKEIWNELDKLKERHHGD